jgi:hypothetical protein
MGTTRSITGVEHPRTVLARSSRSAEQDWLGAERLEGNARSGGFPNGPLLSLFGTLDSDTKSIWEDEVTVWCRFSIDFNMLSLSWFLQKPMIGKLGHSLVGLL